MAGLILKLGPNERVLINGVVMENGDRKTTLKIKTPDAAILRLRDALHPDDVRTPVSSAYYAAQLAVAGSTSSEDAAQALRPMLETLAEAFTGATSATAIASAREGLRKRNFYSVMRSLKPLLQIEKELLSPGGTTTVTAPPGAATPGAGAAGSAGQSDGADRDDARRSDKSAEVNA